MLWLLPGVSLQACKLWNLLVYVDSLLANRWRKFPFQFWTPQLLSCSDLLAWRRIFLSKVFFHELLIVFVTVKVFFSKTFALYGINKMGATVSPMLTKDLWVWSKCRLWLPHMKAFSCGYYTNWSTVARALTHLTLWMDEAIITFPCRDT